MLRMLIVLLLLGNAFAYGQENENPTRYHVGLAYGFGQEFKNRNYTYSNRYIQAQVYYTLLKNNSWEYRVALQPEINFAQHQLMNLYFVTPDEPDYKRKREEYTKLKNMREYILNVAFFVKYNFSKTFSAYAMLNVGPMVTDTEIERLTKGFAFCDVFALGGTVTIGDITLDVRPNVRHVSNAGLQDSNAGLNTYNLQFGVTVPIK